MEEGFILTVKARVVENHELTDIEKLIHSMTLTLHQAGGVNAYQNKYIAEQMDIHPNKVSLARKSLISKGYEVKTKNQHLATSKNEEVTPTSRRDLKIPSIVLGSKVPHGAKLLWGEYNTFRDKPRSYMASRIYAAKRFNCSVDTISGWTKRLDKAGLLEDYFHLSGNCTKQRVVRTKDFTNQKVTESPKTRPQKKVKVRQDETPEQELPEAVPIVSKPSIRDPVRHVFEKVDKQDLIDEYDAQYYFDEAFDRHEQKGIEQNAILDLLENDIKQCVNNEIYRKWLLDCIADRRLK